MSLAINLTNCNKRSKSKQSGCTALLILTGWLVADKKPDGIYSSGEQVLTLREAQLLSSVWGKLQEWEK